MTADFSGSGTVGADDLNIWKTNYGTVNTATQPQGDTDDDMDVDGADFLAWQRQVGDFILVAPRNVNARAVGATSIQVTWEASANAIDYLVARREPSTETFFTAIATNVVGTSYTDSTGLVANTLYEYFIIAQRNPSSSNSQVVQAIADRANLTVYRPQGVYDPDDTSTPDPIYDPFPRRPVQEADETNSEDGPGIRINTDDDDNSGFSDSLESGSAITRENDLIELKIDRLPGQGNMVLAKNFEVSLFFDHNKDTPVPLDTVGNTTLPLPFVNNTVTVWVEWTSTTHSTADVVLYQVGNLAEQDSVRFHSFQSLIIAFGGNTQDPADTSGDGSIGDFVNIALATAREYLISLSSCTTRDGTYWLSMKRMWIILMIFRIRN